MTPYWHVLAAGTVPMTDEVIGLYQKELSSDLKAPTWRDAEIIERLRKPLRVFRQRLAEHYTHAKHGVSYKDFLENGQAWFGEEIHRQTIYEISSQFSHIENNIELILIGIDSQKHFALYKVSRGEVHQCTDFAAIGSGAVIAEPMLYRRESSRFEDLDKTIYMVYEAKILGETAPGVGKRTMMAVLGIDQDGYIDTMALQDKAFSKLWSQFQHYGPKELPEEMEPINYFE